MAHDVVIVGGGIVGLALALALAQQTSLSIALLEAKLSADTWHEDQYGDRVSAMTIASQRILQKLGVWDTLASKRVSPFTKIVVWDATAKGQIEFAASDIAESALGYIVENNLIQAVLTEKLRHYPRVSWQSPVVLTEIYETDDQVRLLTAEGQTYTSQLVVAADGAHSWVREATGISLSKQDYQQTAIVATVTTALPHQGVARQVFLPSGPLAFLPLSDANTSSIVWSLSAELAAQFMAATLDEFAAQLTSAFAERLGAVAVVSQRFRFPLVAQQAKQYVKSRVVLVGDAAHTVHPLAGQGVNMGLLDAASLVEIISEARQFQCNLANTMILRRYERWRRADNMGLLKGVDLIKILFANDQAIVAAGRAWGLNRINQFAWLKNVLTRYAVGKREGLPRLAQ